MDITLEDNLSALDIEDVANQPQKLEELAFKLQERIMFYKEQNAVHDAMFAKMKLVDENMQLIMEFEEKEVLQKLCDIQEKLGVTTLDKHSMLLAYANELNNFKPYGNRLKMYIKVYVHLNEKMAEKLSILKRELDQTQANVNNIFSISNIQALNKKVNTYQEQLISFQKKYPWLNDSTLTLPNIAQEANNLFKLKEEKQQLLNDVNVFQDLKPDLKEALQQLAKVKKENKELTELLKSRS